MGSCRARSVYLTTSLLGRQSSKQLTSIVYILSPETDNCPSCISGRERIEVPWWGPSNEYPQYVFCGEIRKISELFGRRWLFIKSYGILVYCLHCDKIIFVCVLFLSLTCNNNLTVWWWWFRGFTGLSIMLQLYLSLHCLYVSIQLYTLAFKDLSCKYRTTLSLKIQPCPFYTQIRAHTEWRSMYYWSEQFLARAGTLVLIQIL